ncbi:hypothetical protein M8818_005149 [Zalaria obscura]|uniref:Uncharacterized protein n=1 Tax=Zalaria obscura TaxID=2024903 RepID=A0ACC3SAH5_9PEZI
MSASFLYLGIATHASRIVALHHPHAEGTFFHKFAAISQSRIIAAGICPAFPRNPQLPRFPILPQTLAAKVYSRSFAPGIGVALCTPSLQSAPAPCETFPDQASRADSFGAACPPCMRGLPQIPHTGHTLEAPEIFNYFKPDLFSPDFNPRVHLHTPSPHTIST